MSNYTKATNFATKDTLPTGNAGKIVKGTELDTEFNAIASAVATKADTASPTFTGTPAAPTASSGTNTTQLATTAFVTAALTALYPVGSIYINATSSSNPNTLLGFGTWEAFGAGRVMVGLNASNTLFDTVEETGGSADAITVSHTHTATSVVTDPGHTHVINLLNTNATSNGSGHLTGTNEQATTYSVTSNSNTTGISVATTNDSTGSSGTNANYQPYIVVRMWKRTA
jgi:hypothetical protein